jgi:2-octaprenyl-6-methoxyphenol hydroxylase
MSVSQVDVAIIGGGMVGASLAAALSGSGVATMLVEGTAPGSAAQPSFDDRTTALGNASRRIFQGLGVWQRLAGEAAAIRTIHVSDAGRFGFARLTAQEQGIEAFGYVIPNRVIGAALWEKLRSATDVLLRVPARPEQVSIGDSGVTFTLGGEAVAARLVVAADGAHSVVRTTAGIEAEVEDYDQIAIVANVAADRPHDGTAYERFTDSGPLAVLPLYDGSYGVIWTCRPERAAQVLSFDDATYLRELQERFGWRAGRFVRAGVRGSYPLKLSRAAATVAPRTVLIGNAAQALHPVAGQGFNLGLRDAAMLAEIIVGAHENVGSPRTVGLAERVGSPDGAGPAVDVGSPDLLGRFAAWRAGDRSGVIRFTDGLVKLFGDSRPGVGLLRNLGLLLFDLSPPAKSALARIGAGFTGPTPRLARGLSLQQRSTVSHTGAGR